MELDEDTKPTEDIGIIRPTRFSSSDKTQFLELDESRLSVQYVGKGLHQHDVGISSRYISPDFRTVFMSKSFSCLLSLDFHFFIRSISLLVVP